MTWDKESVSDEEVKRTDWKTVVALNKQPDLTGAEIPALSKKDTSSRWRMD
jgi:hypothetical protein